ncbi:MAG TPA: DUF2807 domain-containing protein [Candidatus Limnocylindrales bacterium]|jgi:hypothetical protein|nr:DUF2807 domain-containing protein [Candidatus Limnocylindrales bacterium]
MSARASRRRLAVTAAALVLAFAVAACGDAPIQPEPTPVTGSGDLVTEDRTAGAVDRISVGAAIDVVMRTGDATSVTITGEPNVIPLVVTETRDGQLIVNVPNPGYITQQPVTLTVVAPTIASIALSSAAKGSLQLTADSLRVDLSGKASLAGAGRVEHLAIVASSDGRIDFTPLVAGAATVDMSGGAAATLTVEGALSGQASGGATITLTRQPASVTVEATTGASVQGPG